ncbi:unnamed protein product [Durusdinium trenchii]|uniref:DNA (cytosine-5-)-methyltransferase n=1 Tax=Durusdinium trenchii TaxID=1381693 RepID=A0ABP0I785_9DINO
MQPGTYLQQERHGKVVQLLQLASSERDVTQRVKLLLQSQELLLKADTYPETVATCLEFFLNLQADPSAPLRRFAAYFLERLLLSKPSLCLRCTLAIAALLADSDLLVKELALKAAAVHHSRALHAISKEQDPSEGQQLAEQLRRLQEKARVLLYSDHPVLLAAASGWAQMVILSQTPAPLLWHVQRVPMELRGVSCIQDLPSHVTRGSAFIDTVVLQQQAEQLYELLLQLLQQSISGYNDAGKAKAPFLMRVLGSVARQRPAMLAPAVDIFKKILQQRKDVLGDQSFAEVQNLVTEEVQVLLASQLTSEWHLELMELLDSLQRKGSLEDLTTQAKIKQICSVEGPEAADSARAQKRARKAEPKQVWTSPGDALSAEAIYDADAILSGEAEATCKRLEEYFGLPSQREPAGHVPAPALLATRINSQAELARIALTSLSSLSLQRSLHRDRAHEFAVSFSEGAGLGADAAEEAEASADFVALLMEGKRKEEKDAPTAAEEEKTRDPRAAAGQVLAEGASKRGEAIKTPEEEIHLLEMDASKLQLPRGKDVQSLALTPGVFLCAMPVWREVSDSEVEVDLEKFLLTPLQADYVGRASYFRDAAGLDAFLQTFNGPLGYASDCSGLDAPLFALQQLLGPKCKVKYLSNSEMDATARRFLNVNHTPPMQTTEDMFHLRCGPLKKKVGIYAAGFPCTPYSLLGGRLLLDDANAAQMWQVLHHIQQIKPAAALLENVEGFKCVIDTLLSAIQEKLKQYQAHVVDLDPQNYGCPIARPRVYIILVMKSLQDLLFPRDHWYVQKNLKKCPGVRNKHAGQKKPMKLFKWPQLHRDWAKEKRVNMKKAARSFASTFPHAADQITSKRELQAAELVFAHKGKFEAINTSQSIHRMPAVYGNSPLMTLTPGGTYLIADQQRFLTGAECLLLMGIRINELELNDFSSKDLMRLGGNSMSVHVLFVALAIVLRSLDPEKLQEYLA